MTTTAIEDAAQRGRIQTPQLTYGYYRQSNGWITASPMTELEELKYRREGWEPLDQYGRLEMASEYMADHPFEVLFMRGGVAELPREQIIAMGLHLNPPVVPICQTPLNQNHKRHSALCWQGAIAVVFPQLEGEALEGFACRFCQRAPFPTDEARTQHEGVMHREEKSDIRTGETLAGSLVEGLRGAGALVNAHPGTAAAQPAEHDYICGRCSAGFSNLTTFGKHVKEHDE